MFWLPHCVSWNFASSQLRIWLQDFKGLHENFPESAWLSGELTGCDSTGADETGTDDDCGRLTGSDDGADADTGIASP